MAAKHLGPENLQDKTIDSHSHAGVELKAYSRMEFPYAETIEGLYHRQISAGVDVNVVFPFSGDLFFDPVELREGIRTPARSPASRVPYAVENRLLLREVFEYCPELSLRFLPFVSMDPAREVAAQLDELNALDEEYAIYGLKINPVGCQSHVIKLLSEGRPLMELAERKGWPILFHTAPRVLDEYSGAEDVFQVVSECPGLRFCLAHCILFHRDLLDHAAEVANVWVDTAAMKIQVDLVRQLVEEGTVRGDQLIDADYSDYLNVMRAIVAAYPDTILWGSDTPAYSYICRRKQGEDTYRTFRYKGVYEDEIQALRGLSEEDRTRVSNGNTLAFLFGKTSPADEGQDSQDS
jgi:predicted TIM-barrel fold metal-dependent hydrolase